MVLATRLQVELERFGPPPAGTGSGEPGELVGCGKQVVRACIARVPGGGYPRVEISEMGDVAWGVDGFDT